MCRTADLVMCGLAWWLLPALAAGGCGDGRATGSGDVDHTTAPTDTATTGDSTTPDDGATIDTGSASDTTEPDTTRPEVTSSADIGPEGGELIAEGARLVVPPGALSEVVTITMTRTQQRVEAGYTAYSPLWKFEPDGLTFAVPAMVELPFEADAARATVFWSHPNRPGFEWLSSTTRDGVCAARITHFSEGFVGDGVQYTDPPDLSCASPRILEGRLVSPSGVALFFTVDDCFGNPITDLRNDDFKVKEDGNTLSVESYHDVLPLPGLTAFVTLSLDLSGSTTELRPQIVSGAKGFVTELRDRLSDHLLVTIEIFAGMPDAVVLQPPTFDLDAVLTKLDEVETYEPTSTASTNLNGAVIDALDRNDENQAGFRARNRGGAFTTGYVVVFTDGSDQAGYHSAQEVQDAEAASQTAVLGIGVESPDYDQQALVALAPSGVFTAADGPGLTNAFGALANRIAGQMKRTYLLGYCSPKRAGTHTVTIEYGGAAGTPSESVGYEFPAAGFADGCAAPTFTDACDGKDCGGLGCGACYDPEAVCAGPAGDGVSAVTGTRDTCVSFCAVNHKCGGQSANNPFGYDQVCEDSDELMLCDGSCRGVLTDVSYCGDCATQCATGGICTDGECMCPGVMPAVCDGACTDLATDEQHCNDCATVCATGGSCAGGECTCPGAMPEVCDGVCKDLATDEQHCGDCAEVCATGGSCSGGECRCPGVTPGACDGVCKDLATDESHCGDCTTVCATGGSCVGGECTCPGEMAGVCDGTCRNFAEDEQHCGDCATVCGSDTACVSGTCVTIPPCGAFELRCKPGFTCSQAWASDSAYDAFCVSDGTASAFGAAAEMVFVPTGTFWMGCNSALDTSCNANESPQHEVTLSAYAIDRLMVTAAQYKTCVTWGGGACTTPIQATGGTYDAAEKQNHPINAVNWNQAKAYCAWRGKRLCTEAEWERAARGGCETVTGNCQTEMRKYPWGNTEPSGCQEANWNGCSISGGTSVVGWYRGGASPYGARDLAGNAREWVSDWFGSYAAEAVTDPQGPGEGSSRAKRGCPNGTPADYMRTSIRGGLTPTLWGLDIGFRCCRSYP